MHSPYHSPCHSLALKLTCCTRRRTSINISALSLSCFSRLSCHVLPADLLQEERAIRCAVRLSDWQTALSLAAGSESRACDTATLDRLLASMQARDQALQVVQVCAHAGRRQEAAAATRNLIRDVTRIPGSQLSSGKRIRLLHQLSGLMAMLYMRTKDVEEADEESGKRTGGRQRSTLSSLLRSSEGGSAASQASLEDPWRGCEATHWFLMGQAHLAAGDVKPALACALLSRDADAASDPSLLDPEEVNALIAVSAIAARAFDAASRAFLCLESLPSLTPARRDAYRSLAGDLFARHPPHPLLTSSLTCPACESRMPEHATCCPACETRFPACVVSGQAILSPQDSWTCDVCRRSALLPLIASRRNCPLCHQRIKRATEPAISICRNGIREPEVGNWGL